MLTCLSTWWVRFSEDPRAPWDVAFWSGVWYAAPLMLILVFHEFGHFLQAVRWGVPASPPYFIPFPFLFFGTMGAVIVQSARWPNRRVLFDIAATGPLAGLVIALPVAWWGVSQAEVVAFPPDANVFRLNDPLVMRAMVWLVHGTLPPNHDLLLNPLLWAGWLGIFITGLNLLPIGQLDGGHIVYALYGRRAHGLSIGLMAMAAGYMVFTLTPTYLLLFVLLLLFGVRHPPTLDDRVPLGPVRTAVAWLTLAFLPLGFTAQPIEVSVPEPPPPPRQPRRAAPLDFVDVVPVRRSLHAAARWSVSPWSE